MDFSGYYKIIIAYAIMIAVIGWAIIEVIIFLCKSIWSLL